MVMFVVKVENGGEVPSPVLLKGVLPVSYHSPSQSSAFISGSDTLIKKTTQNRLKPPQSKLKPLVIISFKLKQGGKPMEYGKFHRLSQDQQLTIKAGTNGSNDDDDNAENGSYMVKDSSIT